MYVITDELLAYLMGAITCEKIRSKLKNEARHIDIKDFDELKEILDTMGYLQTGEYPKEAV